MKQKLITPAQAADLKGVSRATIYAAIADQRLPHQQILGRLALDEADVLAWEPVRYAGRPGRAGGRPKGDPTSEETRRRISEAQKQRWARRKALPPESPAG